jgi:N-acetylglucosamine kinase-like BadF-type ATPase
MSEQAAPRYLGIDGGGSKTIAVIVDEHGSEVGRGAAAGGNHHAAGLERAVKQIQRALQQAQTNAGGASPIAGAWIGLAGMDNPADRTLLLPQLQPLATHIRLTNDAELLLSALPGAVGVTLIAGTGAIALGSDTHSNSVRANGWGHLIGDEGSGYAIGQAALRAATRAADGRGPATTLLTRIAEIWELSGPEDIITYVYANPDKATIARLAPLVFDAWRSGDAVAGRIIRQAAGELAASVLAVAKTLDLPHALPLACGGALLTQAEDYRKLVFARLWRTRPIAPVVVTEPALAAARAMLTLQEESRA